MSDQSKLGLGQIITKPQERDAIHIAVAPVHAAFELYPGQHIGINTDGNAIPAELREGIGIADPFLKTKIMPGDSFWLFLYPGSITSLKHQWSHPAFDEATGTSPAPQNPSESERWMREFADQTGRTYEDLLVTYREAARTGYACVGDDGDQDTFNDVKEKFIAHGAALTGIGPKEDIYFSCAC